MNKNISDDIIVFKNNLDLQLEDLDLESTGTSIELYFDTSDVFRAVLGLEAFYTLGEGLDFAKFNDKRALVHSLLASGWLGEYRLLPPHETEFLTHVNLHFGVGIDMDPEGRARKFLEELNLATKHSKGLGFDDLSNDQSYDSIKKQAGLAETMFKAVQCIIPWHKRLPRLLSQNILVITPPKIHLIG